MINYKELASRKGIGASSGVEAQYSSISEQQTYSNSKLLDPFKNTTRYNTPTYYQLYYGDVYGFSHRERIQIFPYPIRSYIDNNYSGSDYTFTGEDGNTRVYPDTIQIFYTRKPLNPNSIFNKSVNKYLLTWQYSPFT